MLHSMSPVCGMIKLFNLSTHIVCFMYGCSLFLFPFTYLLLLFHLISVLPMLYKILMLDFWVQVECFWSKRGNFTVM